MKNMSKDISCAVAALNDKQVIAYPTESIYGLGCDPDCEASLLKILAIKQRPSNKGLILIAYSLEQLLPYIEWDEIAPTRQQEILSTWPGPITWVFPCRSTVHPLVKGQFDSVAVRVTAHPIVQELCLAFGKPITSTSANLSGMPACQTAEEVQKQLNIEQGIFLLSGETQGRLNPSVIRDATTGTLIRQG